MKTALNKTIILRLAKYLRVLKKLKGLGFVNVFSNNLGDAIGVTPAIVRKDFSLISIPGNKRGGYNIDELMNNIQSVLGKDEEQEVVIVGCGRIGKALMQFSEFAKEGIRIVAGFDVHLPENPKDEKIPIYSLDFMEKFCSENNITVGIIAVPDNAAIDVFNRMRSAGIKGFLNFTSVELKCGENCMKECEDQCVIQHVNIGLEIENLFYLVHLTENS